MLLLHWKSCIGGCAIIFAFIIFSTYYAYSVNAKRDSDDPEKKDFSPYAIWLVPIILPLLFIFDVFILILSSLAFGLFMVFFPIALLLFRKPFLINWILTQAHRIGNKILIVNTELLKAVGIYPASAIKLQTER